MSSQFDKKLINRINEVFDHFEDDSVNEGWQELRKQLPKKEKKLRGIWWYSSAAAILLISGFWFFSNPQNQDKEDTVKIAVKRPLTTDESKDELAIKKDELNSTDDNTSPVSEPTFATPGEKSRIAKHESKLKSVTTPVYINDAQPVQPGESKAEHNLMIIALSPGERKQESEDKIIDADKSLDPSSRLSVNTDASREQVKEIFPSEVVTKEELTKLVGSEKKDNTQTDKKISLAIFAGSYFNYAEGSETSMNTSVGISSEVKLSKKLKLSTGLSLAQNSLKFDQSIPIEATANFGKTGNNSGALAEYYNSPSGLAASISSPSINSYNARLLGFDIPVNLKYLLLQKKNTVYLSTGFSSNFFISESYTYDYNYKINGNTLENTDQQSTNRFQSFDFARVLNFSIGLEQTLNKKTKLSFEPFIKYPLSGLGSHDLRFGAAGMNLKFNFNR